MAQGKDQGMRVGATREGDMSKVLHEYNLTAITSVLSSCTDAFTIHIRSL